MIDNSGNRIRSRRKWKKIRKREMLEILAENEYGFIPEVHVDVKSRIIEKCDTAMGGIATRKQIELTFRNQEMERKVLLLMYIPNFRKGRASVFLKYNFQGNHCTTYDPVVLPSRYSPFPVGNMVSRWPYKMILGAGYAVATVHYYDIYPDNHDCFQESVMPLFGYNSESDVPDNGPGAISCWAWGYSRIMDYLETDKDIDPQKVIVSGLSRLGKAALWAGANDARFSIVISTSAGCSGDALARRNYGETVEIISDTFPYWFCRNYQKYAENEVAMPFDQHFLLALIAPRPLYIVAAENDRWTDQKGQLLCAHAATPAWELYGYTGIQQIELPPLHHPIMERIGFHLRSGKHDVTSYDWYNELVFTNKWLYGNRK